MLCKKKISLKSINILRSEEDAPKLAPVLEARFEVLHNNGRTSVKEDLVLQKDKFGKWVAKIDFSEIPRQESSEEAALKLGDWLCRIGESLKENGENIQNFNLNEL